MKVRGAKSLAAKLRAIPRAAREEIRGVLEKGAAEMSTTAKAFAPKRSGALASSIGYTFGAYQPDNANVRGVGSGGGSLDDPDLTVTIHAGNARAFYAAFVEFGTAPHTNEGKFEGSHNPGAPAQPFFFPAYRLTKKRNKSRITRATTKAAKRVAAGGK
jgi:HK97 gp10 family phage protein